MQRAFWCVLEGLIAIALLLGGGLLSLQAAARNAGSPPGPTPRDCVR